MMQKDSVTPSGIVDITFTTRGTLTNTGTVFYSTVINNDFGHEGLDTKKLAAGATGRIWLQNAASDDQYCMIGFATTNALTSYTGMSAAFYHDTRISYVDGGSAHATGTLVISNYYYCVYRDGVTGVLKIQSSPDALVWSDEYTFTFNSTADLFIVCDVLGQAGYGHLYNPKGDNIH